MKYYIRRTIYVDNHPAHVAYKHYKCADGFVREEYKSSCWKFSKQGARGIINALNEEFKQQVDAGNVVFDMIPAEEE